MSETNEKELDSYGVWIKKAPNEFANEDFNFDADLPDFSDIDVSSFDSKSETEDVALDDFFDDDFSDAKVENKTSNESEEVALDDFLDNDFSESKTETTNEVEPLDIDLSFDSANAKPTESAGITSDNFNEASDSNQDNSSLSADTEEIDISDFGIDMSDDSHAVEESAVVSNTTKDYELSVEGETDANEFPEPVVENFDAEAKSLMDNVTEPAGIRSDETLLRQIASDLSGLKTEIKDLKNEFAELKNRSDIVVSKDETKDESEGGFFSDLDEDETISLSGDELDNIMNTSDFAAESESVSTEIISNETPIENANETSSGGFFSDVDEDETIALSGNELDNILSTSEVATENISSENVSDENETSNEFVNDTISETTDLQSNANLDFPAPIDENEDNTFHNVETDDNLVIDFDEKIEEEGKDANDADELLKIDDIELPKASEILPTEAEQEVAPIESEAPSEFVESEVTNETNTIDESKTIEEPAFDVNNYFNEDPSGVEAFVKDELAKEKAENVSEVSEDAEVEVPAFDVNNYFNEDPSGVEAFVKDELSKENENTKSKTEQTTNEISDDLKEEIKSVLLYMDKLLENLPETKIVEFAKSEEFSTYKKLFETLGIA